MTYIYVYTVEISNCQTSEQADQVMGERLGFDEDYGFDYAIDWGPKVQPKHRDLNICFVNLTGIHGPLEAHWDPEIADTHFSVACKMCGTTTGYPIPDVDELEWN